MASEEDRLVVVLKTDQLNGNFEVITQGELRIRQGSLMLLGLGSDAIARDWVLFGNALWQLK